MTKPTQDKETLREAVARAIHSRSGKGGILWRDLLDDEIWEFEAYADAAIATMFERLRTPSETVLDAGWSSFENAVRKKKPWHEVMAKALHGALTAFQQENSDGR